MTDSTVKTTHILLSGGPQDTFTPTVSEGEALLVVPFHEPDHPDRIPNRITEILDEYSLIPSPAALDLLEAAIAAYSADVRVSRKKAFDGWTRDLKLYLSLREASMWEGRGSEIFEKMLRFLTGDHWTVEVRARPLPTQAIAKEEGFTRKKGGDVNLGDFDTACLFSGGMDSFAGACQVLSDSKRAVLVGHHALGGGASKSQNEAEVALREFYDEQSAPFLQFFVNPPKGDNRESENTTRGRSVMFLGLGIAVSSALAQRQGKARLIIPENGFISLNVPLTTSRLGSFSTRTTHPYLISLMRELLAVLKIPVALDLPFRFQTKGEMLRSMPDAQQLQASIEATMSCSHPGANRFKKGNRGHVHCGHCFPCLIRRASVAQALGNTTSDSDSTIYAFKLTDPLTPKRRVDIRAVKLALDRWQKNPPRLTDLLISGPLPTTGTPPNPDDELNEYFAMFERGLEELRQLF